MNEKRKRKLQDEVEIMKRIQRDMTEKIECVLNSWSISTETKQDIVGKLKDIKKIAVKRCKDISQRIY